jgi:hypothetical protein
LQGAAATLISGGRFFYQPFIFPIKNILGQPDNTCNGAAARNTKQGHNNGVAARNTKMCTIPLDNVKFGHRRTFFLPLITF